MGDSSRDQRYDLLKVAALVAIVLSHVRPPAALDQLRNFDVPLLVLISGAAYALSTSDKPRAYWAYLRRRLPRLVLPMWVFLALFLPAFWLLMIAEGRTFPFTIHESLSVFLFSDRMGYTWILRVLIACAIAAPLFESLRRRLGDVAFGILAALFTALTALYNGQRPDLTGVPGYELYAWRQLFEIPPYLGLFALGLCLPRADRALVAIAGGALLAVWTMQFLLTNGGWPDTLSEAIWPKHFDKYPPRGYYLTYATGVSLLLLALVPPRPTLPRPLSSLVDLLARRSLSFYFWHIAFLVLLINTRLLPMWSWFFVIVAAGTAATAIQDRIFPSAARRG